MDWSKDFRGCPVAKEIMLCDRFGCVFIGLFLHDREYCSNAGLRIPIEDMWAWAPVPKAPDDVPHSLPPKRSE